MAVHTKESKLNAVKDVVIFKNKKIEVADKYKIIRRSLDNSSINESTKLKESYWIVKIENCYDFLNHNKEKYVY